MRERANGEAPRTPGGGTAYHEPVLAEEAVGFLTPRDGGLYLDGTVGGGGHALLLLERCAGCRLVAVDRDPAALDEARRRLAAHGSRVRFLRMGYDRAARDEEVRGRGLDGVLLDLGVSSRQLDDDARGFTFRRGAPLDMRMDPVEGEDAARFLATAGEDRLAEVFRELGEEPRARRLAREIVKRRATAPLGTSDDLVAALSVVLDRRPTQNDKARIFQAVRIAVNDELGRLERGLLALRDVLLDDGVLAVIAYHSLEDRMVKNHFRKWSRSCVCPPAFPRCMCRGRALGTVLTRSPIRPGEEEVGRNPRARSARLRAWRKVA